MSEASVSRGNGRKRTRPSFLGEDNTPSDPALFSSDPPDPGAEHYFAPRRKKQYRGTWWQNGTRERRGRKAFERNMDSGIFMGSDSSLESLDIEATEDNLHSDGTIPDESLGRGTFVGKHEPIVLPRKVQISEPPSVLVARKRIAYFVEDGSWEDSDELDPDIQEWVQSRYSHVDGGDRNVSPSLGVANYLDLSRQDLPYLTDDMLAPLQQMIKQPRWEKRTRRARGGSDDSDCYEDESTQSQSSLNSDEDLDELCKPYNLDLSYNALSELPPSIYRMPGIVRLFVGNNNLSQLSSDISNLRQLKELSVVGNRLRWLPGEAIDLIQTSEQIETNISVRFNPLLQPFSYVGLRNMIEDEEKADDVRVTVVPYTITDLEKRMARIRALMPCKGLNRVSQELVRVQQSWILRLYEHYLSLPELLWLGPCNGREPEIPAEEQQNLLRRWGVVQETTDRRVNFLNALINMRNSAGPMLRRRTICMAATPVCYLGISGHPIHAGVPLPSGLPMDQMILPARLLAVPKVGLRKDREQSELFIVDEPFVRPLSHEQPRVHSLFSLSLASASQVPELHHLPTLLPDTTPSSVRCGLDHALEARREGGRKCYVCKRSYILPRAEWIEYHVLSNIFEKERYAQDGLEDLFVPFLRKVCSWGCVPHFEYDDELVTA